MSDRLTKSKSVFEIIHLLKCFNHQRVATYSFLRHYSRLVRRYDIIMMSPDRMASTNEDRDTSYHTAVTLILAHKNLFELSIWNYNFCQEFKRLNRAVESRLEDLQLPRYGKTFCIWQISWAWRLGRCELSEHDLA